MWHRETNPFIQHTLVLLLPKQPWCIFILNSQLLTELQLLPQSRQVPQCRLHCRRHQCLKHRGWGKWQMLCSIVCVCVCVCLNSYCKWDLKNWHSHPSSAPHLSQTNEGPEPQSEIDISFWASQGIFWIWRRVSCSRGTQRLLLFSFPHLHANNNRKKWPGYIFGVHQYSLIHRVSWQLICRQAQHNG